MTEAIIVRDGRYMEIRFKFDDRKALQAMAYAVARSKGMDKIVLMKLMYFADRDHFIKNGKPITGGRLVAMPYGPLVSECLDMLDVGSWGQVNAFECLHLDDNRLTLRKACGTDLLSESEFAELDAQLSKLAAMGSRAYVDEAHAAAEYREKYRRRTSKTIPFETVLKHCHGGDGSKFRDGRPVVSPATADAMQWPVCDADRDL